MILPFQVGEMLFKDASEDARLLERVHKHHHKWSSRVAWEIRGDRFVDYCDASEYQEPGSTDLWFGVFDDTDRFIGAWMLYNIVRLPREREGVRRISAMPAPTLVGDWEQRAFWRRVGRVLDYFIDNDLATDTGRLIDLEDWRFPTPDRSGGQHVWPTRITGGALEEPRVRGRHVEEGKYDDGMGRSEEPYIRSVRRESRAAGRA